MDDVTKILSQIESGDTAAADQLLPIVYDALRQLAAQRMAAESSDHTLLETLEPEKSSIVKLKFFAGMTIEEAAKTLGISRATAQRHWTYARAWLFGKLSEADGDAYAE